MDNQRGGSWRQRVLASSVLVLFLGACGPAVNPAIQPAPLEEWDNSLGCPQSHRQNFFNPYFSWVQSGQMEHSEGELEEYLNLNSPKLSDHQRQLLLEIHQHLMQQLNSRFNTVEERLKYLVELDLGGELSETGWFKEDWDRLYGFSLTTPPHCSDLAEEDSSSIEEPSRPRNGNVYSLYGKPMAWWGAMKTFATLYQSCNVLHKPPMTEIDPPLQGIRFYGVHPVGQTGLYTVANPQVVKQTHYYLKNWTPAQSEMCRDVRPEPPIYDFGGKPYVDPAQPRELNFFRNAGTGSPALGVDCSGFVFSALASVGIRLSSRMPIKASHVYGVNSSMIKNAERSGFDCLAPIGLRQLRAIDPGDIVASNDHVFMIDKVGDDPFGVGRLKEYQCNLNTITYENFNFDIVQSSAAKNFMGVTRMRASDYLRTDLGMRRGLEDYALSLCLARFGRERAPTRTHASILRVRSDSSCLDNPLTLSHQSCVKDCFDADRIFQKIY